MDRPTAVETPNQLSIRERIFDAVRAVPFGAIVSYGDVGRACGAVAVVVGKAMAHAPADVPWQRVIGSGGELRTARRDAACAARQRALLEVEGIAFDGEGRVLGEDPGWERGFTALNVWRESGPTRRT